MFVGVMQKVNPFKSSTEVWTPFTVSYFLPTSPQPTTHTHTGTHTPTQARTHTHRHAHTQAIYCHSLGEVSWERLCCCHGVKCLVCVFVFCSCLFLPVSEWREVHVCVC